MVRIMITMMGMMTTMVGIMITKLGGRVAHVVTMCGVAPEHLTKYFWWQLTKYSALPVKNTRGCP